MKRASDIFHIIVMPSGIYCWWTLAPTEDGAWDALRQSYPNLSRARRQGCRCVRVRLTLV
jgi:hypothetical protein